MNGVLEVPKIITLLTNIHYLLTVSLQYDIYLSRKMIEVIKCVISFYKKCRHFQAKVFLLPGGANNLLCFFTSFNPWWLCLGNLYINAILTPYPANAY